MQGLQNIFTKDFFSHVPWLPGDCQISNLERMSLQLKYVAS